MAYKTETIMANIGTVLSSITVANGYENTVGTVLRTAVFPEEEEIPWTSTPVLIYHFDNATVEDEKAEYSIWTQNIRIVAIITPDASTPSTKIESLKGDIVKAVLANRRWSTTFVIDTKIYQILMREGFTKPHAAFTVYLNVRYEAPNSSP